MAQKNPLQVWLFENDVTKVELARRVGCSDAHINRICNDDPRVSADLAVRIFRETGVRIGPLRHASDEDAEAVARVLSSDPTHHLNRGNSP